MVNGGNGGGTQVVSVPSRGLLGKNCDCMLSGRKVHICMVLECLLIGYLSVTSGRTSWSWKPGWWRYSALDQLAQQGEAPYKP